MKILDLAKGKHIMVKTDVGVMVELEIERIEPKHNSRDLEPSTAANDWWPAQERWTTYEVYFTNGHKKSYSSLSEIDIY
jgi:hypothetical protein